MPDVTVLQAIAIVRGRYTGEEWAMRPPNQVTAEIYREVRRLDLERVEQQRRMNRPHARGG